MGAKSNAEIDASARQVANETESPAMGQMLGKMWKEMRMFEVPFYAEHVEEEIHHLKRDEVNLKAKVTGAEGKLSTAQKRWKEQGKTKESAEMKTDDEETDKPRKEEEDDAPEEEAPPVKRVGPTNAVPAQVPASQMNFWTMGTAQKKQALMSTLVYFVCGIFFAYIYVKVRNSLPAYFTPAPPQSARKSDKGFSNPLFGCFGDPKICILGTCCPAMRWANTLDNPDEVGRKILPYWKAFFLFFTLGLLHIYTWGISSLMIVAMGVYYRQQLRKRFELESGSGSSIAQDILAWFCCLCCAIVQEARETKEVRRMP